VEEAHTTLTLPQPGQHRSAPQHNAPPSSPHPWHTRRNKSEGPTGSGTRQRRSRQLEQQPSLSPASQVEPPPQVPLVCTVVGASAAQLDTRCMCIQCCPPKMSSFSTSLQDDGSITRR
jgi:hypothetical protein